LVNGELIRSAKSELTAAHRFYFLSRNAFAMRIKDVRTCAVPLPANRDRGEPCGSSPPTPPYIRVRIRRFVGLSAGDLSRQRRRFQQRSPPRRLRSLQATPSGLHPFPSLQRPDSWIFGRMAGSESPHLCVLPTFRPSVKLVPPTMPSADFSAAITNVAVRSVRKLGHVGDLPR
jgi:hypothetical protein